MQRDSGDELCIAADASVELIQRLSSTDVSNPNNPSFKDQSNPLCAEAAPEPQMEEETKVELRLRDALVRVFRIFLSAKDDVLAKKYLNSYYLCLALNHIERILKVANPKDIPEHINRSILIANIQETKSKLLFLPTTTNFAELYKNLNEFAEKFSQFRSDNLSSLLHLSIILGKIGESITVSDDPNNALQEVFNHLESFAKLLSFRIPTPVKLYIQLVAGNYMQLLSDDVKEFMKKQFIHDVRDNFYNNFVNYAEHNCQNLEKMTTERYLDQHSFEKVRHLEKDLMKQRALSNNISQTFVDQADIIRREKEKESREAEIRASVEIISSPRKSSLTRSASLLFAGKKKETVAAKPAAAAAAAKRKHGCSVM